MDMQEKLYRELQGLRLANGLYVASPGPWYSQFAWLRDTFYEALPSLTADPGQYAQTYGTLLAWLKKLEKEYRKFSSMIENPLPKDKMRYLHARIDAKTYDEVKAEWKNKQNDVVGELLYGIYLGESFGIPIVKDQSDIGILNLLIEYLDAIEYWQDSDSGIWEEIEEVRSSSIGACVAGLSALKSLGLSGLVIPERLIGLGQDALAALLPCESATRQVDLALLTLIYPFPIAVGEMAEVIIDRVKGTLERKNGVLRYLGDQYFHNGVSEAEWTLGFCFLGLAYESLGNRGMARQYYDRLIEKCDDGRIPELYFGGTDTKNENTPLGWSNALTYILGEKLKA